MNINEVTVSPLTTKIMAVMQFLIGRSEDTASEKKIGTDTLVSLANDTGAPITKSDLIRLAQQPPLKNMIKNINNQETVFVGNQEEMDSDAMSDADKANKTVAAMAKRAAKKGI